MTLIMNKSIIEWKQCSHEQVYLAENDPVSGEASMFVEMVDRNNLKNSALTKAAGML